jgi:hypothetical protein
MKVMRIRNVVHVVSRYWKFGGSMPVLDANIVELTILDYEF